MKICDFVDIIGVSLIIIKNSGSAFICFFENSVITNYWSEVGGTLIIGSGWDPDAAIKDYVIKIRGKFLSAEIAEIGKFRKRKIRRAFKIPADLTV